MRKQGWRGTAWSALIPRKLASPLFTSPRIAGRGKELIAQAIRVRGIARPLTRSDLSVLATLSP